MNTTNINNNINITQINVYNQMSISLNLINEEKEEKISTKDFICLAQLGRGSFGEVYLVQKINTKKKICNENIKKRKNNGTEFIKICFSRKKCFKFK